MVVTGVSCVAALLSYLSVYAIFILQVSVLLSLVFFAWLPCKVISPFTRFLSFASKCMAIPGVFRVAALYSYLSVCEILVLAVSVWLSMAGVLCVGALLSLGLRVFLSFASKCMAVPGVPCVAAL